jgi:hypothetical protein
MLPVCEDIILGHFILVEFSGVSVGGNCEAEWTEGFGWCSPFAHGAHGLDLEDRRVPADAEVRVASHQHVPSSNFNPLIPPTNLPYPSRHYPQPQVIIPPFTERSIDI